MYHFFAYLSKMKHIKRWGLMRNTETENIKEHSFDVAVTAHALACISNAYFGGGVDACHVMALGMFHEAGELITGDLPTPIKYYNPQIRNAYDEIEKIAQRKILGMLPPALQANYAPFILHEKDASYRLVKAADKICAYIKCIEELKSGNAEFEKAKTKIAGEIAAMDDPAVGYFMENFLPSYALTLDELN